MSMEARTRLYIASVGVAAISLAALTTWLWPVSQHTPAIWLIAALTALVTIAGRFPITLSRQAEASLLIVPLFMAALLLHPAETAIVAAIGTILSELLIKPPPRAIVFNTGVNSLAAVSAGMVLFALSPQGPSVALTMGAMIPAVGAGIALFATNLVLVDSMVTLRKGLGFWKDWKNTFVLETLQEGGLLPVGLLGALLLTQAWWGPVIVAIPAVMTYFGFRFIVSEAAHKARMAQELEQRLTELKELQAQLIHSAKMASVGSLSTGIAHEINNPVFAISGRADLLIRGAEKHLQSDKALEYVRTMQQMAQRIASITRHLMEYAQTDDETKEVSLSEVMDASVALLGKKTSNVRVIRDFNDDVVVSGVQAQLQQVFVNLLSNSVEASPEWGSITLGCHVEGSTAVAYVKDDGVGIPEELKDRLFEPFVTSKEVESRVGMGLGLHTCHRIVSAHRGEISIQSERGNGTTVWVRLPAFGSADQEHPHNAIAAGEKA